MRWTQPVARVAGRPAVGDPSEDWDRQMIWSKFQWLCFPVFRGVRGEAACRGQ